MMIETRLKYFQPQDDASSALVVQVTRLVDSYMLWVGPTNARSAEDREAVEMAPQNGSLCRDWACAMPPLSSTVAPSGTSLLRASSSDLALPMAQRLARRFKRQIFLSIDIPPAFLSMGHGPKLAFEAEKRVVETLKELEQ
ncbi:hypothetical protein ACEPAH_6873 [Sanghuangporus vaninii]